jgi:murein DD-endopeptidase MepM/ murein hydrolase activator NlpD
LTGLVSLFATCKPSTNTTDTEEEDMLQDSLAIVIDNEELEEDDDWQETKAPISDYTKMANGPTYVFQRNKNSYSQSYFRNPFDRPIYVSGTFCELRGNHFHGGLDIRTGGVQGWKVLAAADGYVERIKISTGGYGKAIYIRHPNGFTTVYGHLQKFTGELANYVKEAQYKQRKFEIELFPKRGELKLTKGQAFALSGNTGGSGGPHLHFEIRNPSGQSTNPLLHGLNVTDKLNPEIKRISIYHKDKESLYAEGTYPYTTFSKWSDYAKNIKTLNVKPGKYGFGLLTDDYFTDKKNVLGINYCWLTANGQLLYEYQIEKFNFNQGRYINTHTDPYLKWKDKKTYFRLFKERFNPLPYYKQRNNGEINVAHGDTVLMKLHIQDYVGNEDSVQWTVVGDTSGKQLQVPQKTIFKEKHRISGGQSFKFYEWDVHVPKKAIYHPLDLKLKTSATKPNMLSKTLQMHYGYTPLHSYISVKYTVPAKWLSYGDKLCAVSFDGAKTYYEGGTLKGNILSFKTRSLGQYAIGYDNEQPKLTLKNLGRKFKFIARDNLSGIKTIICSVDDKWILAEYEPKTNTIFGEIPAWIKNGSLEFKLVVIDHKNNRSEFKQQVNL